MLDVDPDKYGNNIPFVLTPNLNVLDFGSYSFLHDTLEGKLVKTSPEIARLIEELRQNKTGHRIKEKLMPLFESGLLMQKDSVCKDVKVTGNITQQFYNPRFHISNKCNMACKYCHVFESKNLISDQPHYMDFKVIQTAFKAYLELIKNDKNPVLQFSFYGGEPLLNWKVIKKALLFGNRLFKNKAIVRWILNTNGTLITPAIAKTLSAEGVDVHISIDGPDESSNQNRKYKSGRSTLKRVLNALKILKQQNCNIQFDSCLTKTNLNVLKRLIDLAKNYGADRIYLALTDNRQTIRNEAMNIDKTASLLVKAMVYAESKGVVLGGPWKCFYPWFIHNDYSTISPIRHLVIESSGDFYLSVFPEKKIGSIKNIAQLITSLHYKDVLFKLEAVRNSCKGCELEGVCAGFLKGTVRYHTGSFKGSETECCMAKAVFKEYLKHIGQIRPDCFPKEIAITDMTLLEKELIHTRHLLVQHEKGKHILTHRGSGRSIEISEDMLEFIDVFKQKTRPNSLLEKYYIPNIVNILQQLISNNIIIDNTWDEEFEFLEKHSLITNKKIKETLNCICLYPSKENHLAGEFMQFFQELYLKLDKDIRLLNKKMILYLCKNRDEIIQFWFEPSLPDWVKAFVSHRRILVVDIDQIKDIQGYGDFKSVTGMSHEIIHIILGEMNTFLPIWAEEGLCEYFSKPDPNEKLLSLMKHKRLFSFNELELKVTHNLLDIDNTRTEENICYRQSHSFMAYLVNTFGKFEMLTCIKETGLGSDFRQTFLKKFGKTINDMEREWKIKLIE